MADKPLRVVVVGGSIAGLMHGIMLKRLGHDVRILEQHPSPSRDGEAAGVRTGLQAQDFLHKYDRVEEPCMVTTTGLQVMNRNFKRVGLWNWPMAMTTWRTLYLRLKANFDGVSDECVDYPLGAVGGEGRRVFDVGKRVVDVSYEKGVVTLRFEDVSGGEGGEVKADLVIAADGSRSTIRKLLLPDVRAPYAGYLSWRATIPEKLISESTRRLFEGFSTAYKMHRSYVIVYLVPGQNGSLEVGHRHFNFVWYYNCPEDSQEFVDIMTDKDGYRHRSTLPPGKIRPEIWAKQRAYAQSIFAPPMRELVSNITDPFVTAVSDYEAPRASFFDGKLLLVGDALALFRPHVALSTNQAATHCLLMEKVLKGGMTVKDWEKQVLLEAHVTRLKSTALGSWYLCGWFEGGYHILRLLVAMVGQCIGVVI